MATYLEHQFGNYRLVQLLGEGGFAEVYKGEHIHVGTFAAVKVLTTKLMEDEIEQFRNEARTVMGLRHPHIIRVLDFDLAGRIPFIVMDYAPNGSLRTKYPKGTRLQFETIIQYVKQVAAALQYIHNQKLIHRDIKPDNILLGPDNEILISDFGIAAIAHNTQSLDLQQQKGSGTVYYMSPEQIQGKPRPASDQYSLAVVVYEWLCGERPFNGSYWETITQHLTAPPPPLQGKVPIIPLSIEQVVLRALTKDPKQRFSTVLQFADALAQAMQPPRRQTIVPDFPTIETSLRPEREWVASRLNRLGFAVGASSDPGITRKFTPNEDSIFAAEGMREGDSSTQQFGLFVIADGMGKRATGQDASRRAIQAIIEYVLPRLKQRGDASDEHFAQLLAAGIQAANQEVYHHNQDVHSDMGTTITAVLLVGMTAYVANVGDSRTYLLREGEQLRKITTDHSLVARLLHAGQIEPDDIYTHPQRNLIYRSLGAEPAVEVDHFLQRLQIGDRLLLCSDGLWEMVRDPRIEEILKSPTPNPSMIAEALCNAALKGGGEDNVSVIVVKITDKPATSGKLGVQLINKSESISMI